MQAYIMPTASLLVLLVAKKAMQIIPYLSPNAGHDAQFATLCTKTEGFFMHDLLLFSVAAICMCAVAPC